MKNVQLVKMLWSSGFKSDISNWCQLPQQCNVWKGDIIFADVTTFSMQQPAFIYLQPITKHVIDKRCITVTLV